MGESQRQALQPVAEEGASVGWTGQGVGRGQRVGKTVEQHGLRGVSKAGKCGLQEETERASPAPVPSHVQYV